MSSASDRDFLPAAGELLSFSPGWFRHLSDLRRVMVGLDTDSVQMREVSPMGGLLPQEERAEAAGDRWSVPDKKGEGSDTPLATALLTCADVRMSRSVAGSLPGQRSRRLEVMSASPWGDEAVSGVSSDVLAAIGCRRVGGVGMADEQTEMVTIPRAELDSMKAELRRLRLEESRRVALERIKSFRPDEPGTRVFHSREELAEALGVPD
jgi:hypothetical protein